MQILRITRGKIKPGTWDAFEAALYSAAEAIGQVPGLVFRSLARNTSDPDEGYSLSVWEDMEALRNYEKGELATKINPMLEEFFTGDYHTDHCEVRRWDNRG